MIQSKENSFLCKLGLHKWTKEKLFIQVSSNVIDHSKYCVRCQKVKRWNTLRGRVDSVSPFN